MKIGKYKEYDWLVISHGLSMQETILRYHGNRVLAINAFDGDKIRPNSDEKKLGWYSKNGVMFSPKLHENINIPSAGYDEWYIKSGDFLIDESYESMMNYGRFTLVTPEELYKDFDPTWEKNSYDFLIPLQQIFWQQIDEIQPETYIGDGDNLIVVSKNINFISAVKELVNNYFIR